MKERKKHKYRSPRTNAFTDPERFVRLIKIRRDDGEWEAIPFGLLTEEQAHQVAQTAANRLIHQKREEEKKEKKKREREESIRASKFLILRKPK